MDLYWWLWDEPVYQRRGYHTLLGPQSKPLRGRAFQTTSGL
jgi:hypothetical protein